MFGKGSPCWGFDLDLWRCEWSVEASWFLQPVCDVSLGILGVVGDAGVSSMLAPSTNFTGRLKIKARLSSLPAVRRRAGGRGLMWPQASRWSLILFFPPNFKTDLFILYVLKQTKQQVLLTSPRLLTSRAAWSRRSGVGNTHEHTLSRILASSQNHRSHPGWHWLGKLSPEGGDRGRNNSSPLQQPHMVANKDSRARNTVKL